MTYRFRVTPELLDQIETLLPSERGDDGSPSAHDFIAQDLFAIGDYVTAHWDDLPRIFTSRDDYARYLKPGNTVAGVSLVVQRVGTRSSAWTSTLIDEVCRRPTRTTIKTCSSGFSYPCP